MVEDEAVYYIKDLNFKQKKVFSENQTKKKPQQPWETGDLATCQQIRGKNGNRADGQITYTQKYWNTSHNSKC